MRDFEARMAEIRRRSEVILAKRKRRRRQLLTLCLPLVVCLGLAVFFLLPELSMGSDFLYPAMESVKEDSLANGAAGSPIMGMGATRIEITDGIIASVCLDPERTEPLANLLEELTVLEPESGESIYHSSTETKAEDDTHSMDADPKPTEETAPEDDGGTEPTDIFITVIHPDGKRVEYRLQDPFFCLWRNDRPFSLTPEQLQTLLDALEEL